MKRSRAPMNLPAAETPATTNTSANMGHQRMEVGAPYSAHTLPKSSVGCVVISGSALELVAIGDAADDTQEENRRKLLYTWLCPSWIGPGTRNSGTRVLLWAVTANLIRHPPRGCAKLLRWVTHTDQR